MPKTLKSKIVSLSHYRWAIPIIAEINRTEGSKFVTLANRLSMSRDSLQRTLTSLIELRWVMKNPGYGHPLRPEYILTKTGKQLGPKCQELCRLMIEEEVERVALQKWSLPILGVISQGAERFSEIKHQLPSATARAVTLALKELCQAGLVERAIVEDFPPTTIYKLKESGDRLGKLAQNISRA
jgi:DNA-binding HxlR family transcriptional regulator